MKKMYFFAALAFILTSAVNAQNLVVGGDMESDENWTIVDLAAGDGHTETFGYTADSPSGGSGGCLSLAGEGNWSNVAVCQEITVQRGLYYMISMLVKTSMDFIVESHWCEIVVVPTMPVEDADITAYPNVFALNSWDCPDVLYVDGNFADNNCDNKSALNDTIHLEGEGDTTVVLILKAGGGTAYNVLLDDVSVEEISVSSTETIQSNSIEVFPNPVGNELNVNLDGTIQDMRIYNILGVEVYSVTNVGTDHVTLDFSSPPSGIYYVVVTDTQGNKATYKTLKQ